MEIVKFSLRRRRDIIAGALSTLARRRRRAWAGRSPRGLNLLLSWRLASHFQTAVTRPYHFPFQHRVDVMYALTVNSPWTSTCYIITFTICSPSTVFYFLYLTYFIRGSCFISQHPLRRFDLNHAFWFRKQNTEPGFFLFYFQTPTSKRPFLCMRCQNSWPNPRDTSYWKFLNVDRFTSL